MNSTRVLVAAGALFASLLVGRPAFAQMNLDVPSDGASVSQPFGIGGWAVDTRTSSGPGVDLIHVWAYPNPGSGEPAQFWGEATYGIYRPDIGGIFGSEFTYSGFGLTTWGHAPGVYQVWVFARSTVTWQFDQSRVATVTVLSNPQMSLDTPANGATVAQPFDIAGWALNANAPDTGVSSIQVWAYPNADTSAPGEFWGVASYGEPRGDIASVYGGQFTNTGFRLPITGRAPGVYLVVVLPTTIGLPLGTRGR